jgi:glycosyltransferase involved in cell wall biosynthesis
MKVLFLHQNFPGQFLHLAPALRARGHEVLAMTAETNNRPSPVKVVRYRTPKAPEVAGIAATYAAMAERGATVARACAQMTAQTGFVPDVIFGHCGWGETLFLREVWPRARILGYAEFMYAPTGRDTDFDPEFRRDDLMARVAVQARSTHLVLSARDADACLSPTEWQASTFPPDLRAKISVIHDGIDTDKVRPNPDAVFDVPGGGPRLTAGDEVLSFVSRQLEPYRGYHRFMRALPEVLAARPRAQVVIVGGDGQSYGPRPGGDRSWKQVFLDEVSGRLDMKRVHFVGQVPYAQYLALMQVTRVHAYLSYPFVLSWSMLEAMSAGALVIGSDTPPVAEAIRDGVNGRLVDFFDTEGWVAALTGALADPVRDAPLRKAARETVVAGYDLRRVCLPRLIDFVEGPVQGVTT